MGSLDILLASPEAVPYAKTGGLADVAGALPTALASLGHTVTLVIPFYSHVDRQKFPVKKIASGLGVTLADRMETFDLFESETQQQGFKTWFVAHDRFFDRPELYRDPSSGNDWGDNDERFLFFSKAVLKACQHEKLKPQVIHANDWQTGLIPALLRLDPAYSHPWPDGVGDIATLFTIHNIAYQGNFPRTTFEKLGLDWSYFAPGEGFEYWGKISYLKAGIWFADILNTVSKRYAEEIQSSNEFGCGFEGVLRRRSEDLYGVLNGIDYEIWDPSKDRLIPARYSPGDLSGKRRCKTALRRRAKLPLVRRDVPLIGIISRLADQKGFDLIAETADELLSLDLQIVVLGTGERKYHELFSSLGQKYPKKIAVFLEFNNELAHLIEAGSDMFLMPSCYEPCGLNQLYSLRYGTVPIVRETGGLADTIRDANPSKDTGNGFVFKNYDAKEMLTAVKFALEVYRNKEVWQGIMARGMKQDFSWRRSAEQYVELYRKAMRKRQAPTA